MRNTFLNLSRDSLLQVLSTQGRDMMVKECAFPVESNRLPFPCMGGLGAIPSWACNRLYSTDLSEDHPYKEPQPLVTLLGLGRNSDPCLAKLFLYWRRTEGDSLDPFEDVRWSARVLIPISHFSSFTWIKIQSPASNGLNTYSTWPVTLPSAGGCGHLSSEPTGGGRSLCVLLPVFR